MEGMFTPVLQVLLLYCSCCVRINGQTNRDFVSTTVSLYPRPNGTTLFPTPTLSQPTGTTSSTGRTPTTASSTGPTPITNATPPTPASLMTYVIILGVTTGFFLVSTLLCTAMFLGLCYQKFKNKGETKDVTFEGNPVSPHWIHKLSDQKEESTGVTDLPIWSVKTFTDPTSPSNNGINDITPAITPHPAVPASGTDPKSTITPKRVAPPPPKSKKQKKAAAEAIHEPVEYAVPVPVATSRWYSRKKKPKSHYKELNLNQLQPANPYATPQVSNSVSANS